MRWAPLRSSRVRSAAVVHDEIVVVDPRRPVRRRARELGRVDRGMHVDLGDTRTQVAHDPLDHAPAADAPDGTKWSGKTTPSSAASRRNGKPISRSVDSPDESQRQAELDGELQVDVEELGPQLQRAHVRVEMADVEAPQDRPLDLRPQLAAHLVEVGVIPDVVDRAREAAVAVEQRRAHG